MRRIGSVAAVAAVALAWAVAGCDGAVSDPRGIDAEEAEELERAAHAEGGADGARAEGSDAAGAPSQEVDDGGHRGDDGDRGEAAFGLLDPSDAAADHPLSSLWGLERFAVLDGGDVAFEWANRDELWDEIAVPAGEACREAGPPIDEPLFDEPEPLTAAVDSYWNNRSTSGRGTLVSVMCAVDDPDRGPVERYEAHLIATDPDTGEGRVVAGSEPWELEAEAYDDVAELVGDRDAAMAQWARDQDRVDDDPVPAAEGYGLDAAESPDTDAEQR